MPRLINPVDWSLAEVRQRARGELRDAPIVSLKNTAGHQLHIHPVDARLIRVVHSLPGRGDGLILRNHINPKLGVDGIAWESASGSWEVLQPRPDSKQLSIKGSLITIDVDFSHAVQLSWTWNGAPQEPFLRDFKKAYTYDARSGRVFHYVCREGYMPRLEHDQSANDTHPAHSSVEEFVYGLGEAKGRMMKGGKRYLIDGRDSLGADPEETDPLYKLCPYYAVLNKRTRMAYGLFYNYLGPSIFDLGGEHDFSTGNFRSFSAENGPLDYYVLLGEDPDRPRAKPTLPSIVTQLARLVTPVSTTPAGDARRDGWQASPVLPPLSQFGYQASSLTLSERQDAQAAVIEYVRQAREHGFPIDSMHLSSGYCQDPATGERNYFTWDRQKYPDPAGMGRELEEELQCQVIINVKPWLLETHPSYDETARRGAFVRAAPDARSTAPGQAPLDPDRCGPFETEPARTLHWSVNMGDTGKGSYFDFSSHAGAQVWQELMRRGVLANSITGLWIDNNEMSTLIDDEETVKGEVQMWSSPEAGDKGTGAVAQRMGGAMGEAGVGAVGRGALTMGMARATFECLIHDRPNDRPVIVTRSSVPGMQAFAHGTWSGDNSTTWKSLRWSTKLSLSVALSFGHGLYGHDIGGFAGAHSPSPELLVRWCQQSMWMTRFTVHSWKKISTTLWMYDDVDGITDMLRDAVSFRYRLIPTLYSLYVTDYHRRGWPVIRPLLWHHPRDYVTLTQDSQFLLGSHLLVAPVTYFGARSVSFHLPRAVGEEEGEGPAAWCDIETGRWYDPVDGERGGEVTLDAPLERCPALMRDGGILVLGGTAQRNVHDGPARTQRTALIFPRPSHLLPAGPNSDSDSFTANEGSFVLIEDDGRTNEATSRGAFSELRLGFVARGADEVEVRVVALRGAYKGEWKLRFQLPKGDVRALFWAEEEEDSLKLGPVSEGEDDGARWIERRVSI